MPSRIEPLAAELAQANSRLKAATAALAPKHKGGEWEEFRAAHEDVLRLERELASARGEPHAVPCDFPVKWDVGAPFPFLLCNDYRTFLAFYVKEPRGDWDGTSIKIINPASGEHFSLCLVKFNRCVSAKLGHPNDEVQGGHWLNGRGLDGYTAQIVKNSPWLAEVARTNSVHHCDDPALWKSLNHYVFWFHDSTFECLANSYQVELTSEPMPTLLQRAMERLVE